MDVTPILEAVLPFAVGGSSVTCVVLKDCGVCGLNFNEQGARMSKLVVVAAVLVTLAAWSSSFAGQMPSNVANDQVAAGERMTVSVNADSESNARSAAEKQHPGWKVQSVTKAGKDPKSRLYQVKLYK